jgi:hypothetical protein
MLKKQWYIFFALVIISINSYGQYFRQYDNDYRDKFNTIRSHLGKGQTGEAFVLLHELYKLDTTNHYTNYLIGVCYTEQNIISKNSIKHLEYAIKSILTEYKYIPYTETRAPIFAWYYLCKAYSQNGFCEKAKWAKENFLQFHKDYTDNKYFTENISKFMIDCITKESEMRAKKRKESVVTKEVAYTTPSALYGVQVGAFKELVPIREEFDNLKNVEAFMDNQGVIRYVVGNFSTKSQAVALLNIIKENGYQDAFIVNVNEVNRFSREVIIVDNMSFKTHIMGKIDFRVQIGAFKDSIPKALANIFLEIEGIRTIQEDELTILQVGGYEEYEEAVKRKNELIAQGVPGPFVVAYDNKQKVSVKAAQKYIERKEMDKEIKQEPADNQKKIKTKSRAGF